MLPGLRSCGTAALGRDGLVVLGFVVGGTHVLISNCSRDASRRGLDTAPRRADRRCRRTAADRRCAQRTTRRSGRAGRTQERTPRESVRARCRYPFTRWRYDGSIPSTGDAGSWGRVAIPGRTTAPGDSSCRYGTPRPREPRIPPGWRPDAPTLRGCAPTRTPDRVCRRRPTRRGSTAPYGRWGTSHRCPVRETSPPAADRARVADLADSASPRVDLGEQRAPLQRVVHHLPLNSHGFQSTCGRCGDGRGVAHRTSKTGGRGGTDAFPIGSGDGCLPATGRDTNRVGRIVVYIGAI